MEKIVAKASCQSRPEERTGTNSFNLVEVQLPWAVLLKYVWYDKELVQIWVKDSQCIDHIILSEDFYDGLPNSLFPI